MKRRKLTTDELIERGLLLDVTALRRRGWTKDKIRTLMPTPIYVDGKAWWRLRDAENAENSIGFYTEES